ncbi:MAG: DHH family phosphoesterase [Clostridia bacterium]|nr:DHH family phosphoesterase [Clostridia bacterium]
MIGSAKEIAKFILDNDDIAVITHIRPDGDAYGTALCMTEAIRALGKRAFPACSDPVEEKYAFLPDSGDFASGDAMPFPPKAVLSVDVSDVKRMGDMENVFFACERRACLDHHATNPGFCDINFIDGKAAAAGEMALDVIKELGVALSKDMAVNAYVAISTDTGNFSFSSTTSNTYRYAAMCVDAGADVESLTRTLYRTRSIAKTRLLGYALDRIELFENGRVAAIRLNDEVFEALGATRADANSIVNYLNEIEGVRVGILADEMKEGVKFSFRAGVGADVSKIAKKFGGGGHIAAAGATAAGVTMEEIFPKVIKASCEAAREM